MRAALAAIDPNHLVRKALATDELRAVLRTGAAVDVVAIGKGARGMLSACDVVGSLYPLRHVVGVGTGEPSSSLPAVARWHPSAHPVPDARSVAAAREVLEIARRGEERDVLLLLLSGGASAMAALPAADLTLEDKQAVSRRLLSLGGEIHEVNTVRKHLSAIKGGQLAAANRGTTVTLALSDVVGDDLSSIGSGPAVPDATTYADALDVLERYGGREAYPRAVVEHLTRGAAGRIAETPKPDDSRLARSTARVIGSGATAVAGAHAAATSLGYQVHVVTRPITGEARIAAPELVRQSPASSSLPLCIVAAGETTVRTAGSGKGGRNQEFALAMAPHLDSLGTVVVGASVGTDGVDGPTDAAGAIVDTSTVARAAAAGVTPLERYLDEHNSYVFFDRLGDLIRTGPTGTNVGDLQVLLVGSR